MSEKIYLLREAELQALLTDMVADALVAASEELAAEGISLESVSRIRDVLERQLGREVNFVADAPEPEVVFAGLPEGDAEDTVTVLENTSEPTVVQVDKKSIFEELKGLR